MTTRYPAGSEWRKWDLHVHAPGTKLSDGYPKKNGKSDWEQFCQIIHDSDVVAIGITDYFSLDTFFEFKKQYSALYPDDGSKAFFPNLELRLPEILNNDGESVNIHVIFRPDLTEDDARKFLVSLETETTTGKAKRTVSCSDLKSEADYKSATVGRKSIDDALKRTFGSGQPIETFALVVTAADGIRTGGKGSKSRKDQLVDEIDKQSHAFFASPGSRDYFLNTDRLGTDDKVAAKPVFGRSDSHDFAQLIARLGKHNTTGDQHFHTTWVKADPNYEGLLQTLVEPAHRVAIQSSQPDAKQPYQYISRIKFSGTEDFPAEVVFNPNLNSIIGSRSSGKSALLAFVAHTVDPEGTIQQQMDASGSERKEVGPAAGKTWADVSGITREVEWGSSGVTSGKVIYIPQNSLYSLSEHPDKVTEKIAPSLFRQYPDFYTTFDHAHAEVRAANDDIRSAVAEWFAIANDLEVLESEIRDLGDKKAIEAARDELKGEVDAIKKKSQLTDDEIVTYQQVAAELESKENRLEEIVGELGLLSPLVVMDGEDAKPVPGKVQVSVSIRPTTAQLPELLGAKVEEHRLAAQADLAALVEQEMGSALTVTLAEQEKLTREVTAIRAEHAALIAKHAANAELEEVSKNFDKQVRAIAEIEKKEVRREKHQGDRGAQASKIVSALESRGKALADLQTAFTSQPRMLGEDLTFGVEVSVDPSMIAAQSAAFNRVKVSAYVAKKGDEIDVLKAQAEPAAFLEALQNGKQELNKGFVKIGAAQDTLTITPEVRFTAELEDDVIGGFRRSTMTPGKRALFALTLILNESQEPWPLLIDQPEDDLDSRSIYDTIVPYLVDRKRERQIIMVSHDANLVIGADSEEVIVANRHGADRPNKDGRTFEYLTGSLEHTQALNKKSATVLGRHGIREHSCEILDGGEEAFQKRRDKYKI